MLMTPSPTLFLCYSDLVLGHQLGQGLVWSIVMIESTVLTFFQIFCTCHDYTVGFTCHDNSMCRNGQGVSMPFTRKSSRVLRGNRIVLVLEGVVI